MGTVNVGEAKGDGVYSIGDSPGAGGDTRVGAGEVNWNGDDAGKTEANTVGAAEAAPLGVKGGTLHAD